LKKLSTALIFITGLGFIVLSVLYDVIVLNIPPQDPPPELIAQRIQQYFIKDIISYTGWCLLALGLILLVVKRSRNSGKLQSSMPLSESTSKKNQSMKISSLFPQHLPAEYLDFLKENPQGTEIAFNEYPEEASDDEGRYWNMMSESELLEPREMHGVGQAMNFDCLKLYVKAQREFAYDDFTTSNVGDIPLSRIEKGLVIGDENGDYLYLDSSDNFSVWIYYHDGGDVLRVADSFGEFMNS